MVAVYSELRLRSRLAPEAIEPMKGKILTDDEYDILLDGPCRILKPDGRPLAVYLPGALPVPLLDEVYGTLHRLKAQETDNRGLASGTERIQTTPGSRTRSKLVPSAIIGAFDPKPPFTYCRLTAWSGKELDRYHGLFPLFEAIAAHFKEHVPDRYQIQMDFINKTHPDWRISDTPFSTITVNNTYPTGVHVDAGDLVEGFSTLAVIRRGDYSGGRLVFPEFRVAADMKHGDVLLMDAHEWHGNTALQINDPQCWMCEESAVIRMVVVAPWATREIVRPFCRAHAVEMSAKEGVNVLSTEEVVPAERISVVSYYRTKMHACGSMDDEAVKAAERAEKRSGSMIDEMALEAAGVRSEGA